MSSALNSSSVVSMDGAAHSSSSAAAAGAAAGAVLDAGGAHGANGQPHWNYLHDALVQHGVRGGVGVAAHLGVYLGQIFLAASA